MYCFGGAQKLNKFKCKILIAVQALHELWALGYKLTRHGFANNDTFVDDTPNFNLI